MRTRLILAAMILCSVSLPALAANWACGAIGTNASPTNSAGMGWSVSPTKSEASAEALAQCRSSGGAGCFITGCDCAVELTEDTSCSGQSATEAELGSPPAPPRVFNNIPALNNTERHQVPDRPATAAKPQKPSGTPNGATPNWPSAPRTATQGANDGECDKGDQLLPTAKRIVVNPCSKEKKNVYVPQDQLRHKGPVAERYIRSLSGCRQVVNGVCVDENQKWPDSKAGGPIYLPDR